MKALKIVFIIFSILVIFILSALWYVGFLTKVPIEDKQAGGYIVAGEEFIGPYSKVGPTMNKVDSVLRIMNINCAQSFGIYYSNPNETPKEQCRSFVGNIIEPKDTGRIIAIKDKGLKVDTISSGQALVVEFPYKDKFSFMVGPLKVYPAFTKYMKEKNYKTTQSLEVYDIPNKKILYIMKYSK